MPATARQRRRFYVALALYGAWIVALIVMGVTSAEPPPTKTVPGPPVEAVR